MGILDRSTDVLAARLAEMDVVWSSVAAVRMPRSPGLIEAVLAIVRASSAGSVGPRE